MIPTDELLERRRWVQLGAVGAWALDRTDFAAHVALHASFAAVEQLRRLLDIERTLANQAPDWEVLVQRCRAWRVGLPVSVMLNRARQNLGASVPDDVVRELAGGRLERLVVRQLGGWVPSGHIPGGRSVKNGLTRSLRDGLPATATSFAAETWETLGKLLHPEPLERSDTRHPLHDAGGPAGFERYVEMVESTDRYGHLRRRELRRLALPG